MYQLPPLPPAIRILKDEESERLSRLYPDLPTSLSRCVTCSGKGEFNWWDNYGSEDRKVVTYQCNCPDQFILFKYFLNSGLGKQAQRVVWEDARNISTKVLERVFDYVENADYYVSSGLGLLFHGTHGNGKTLMSYLLLKQLLARGVEGYFTTFTQLLDNFSAGWTNDKLRTWFDLNVRNVPLLVVDDIGREHKGRIETSSSSLDSIFRSRVQNARPTIITTNLSMDNFQTMYSTGVMSLLTESCLIQEFTGPDWRPNQRTRIEEESRLRIIRPITIG